jgi:hypothetical protein
MESDDLSFIDRVVSILDTGDNLSPLRGNQIAPLIAKEISQPADKCGFMT